MKMKLGPAPTLTQAKAKGVLNHILSDLTLTQSCAKAGVGLSSYYRRIDSYPDIMGAIKKSLEAQKHSVKEEAIQTIIDAFLTDWKAAAWFLERRYPDEYGWKIPSQSNETTFVVRNELRPKPRFAMDLTDDPGAKN